MSILMDMRTITTEETVWSRLRHVCSMVSKYMSGPSEKFGKLVRKRDRKLGDDTQRNPFRSPMRLARRQC